MSPIHYFDIIFLVIAAVLVVLGIIHGLIGELVRLFAIVGGLASGLLFYRQLFPYMKFLNISPSAKICIGFIVLFIAGFCAVVLLGWLAQKLVHMTMLGWVDRVGGGVFGFAQAVIVVWIFVRSAESSPFTAMQNKLRSSIAYTILAAAPPRLLVPYFDRSGRSVGTLLRSDPMKAIGREIEKVKEKVDSVKSAHETQKTKKKK